MAHDVFVSYSNKEKVAADAVCHALERNRIRVWMAPRDSLPCRRPRGHKESDDGKKFYQMAADHGDEDAKGELRRLGEAKQQSGAAKRQ